MKGDHENKGGAIVISSHSCLILYNFNYLELRLGGIAIDGVKDGF